MPSGNARLVVEVVATSAQFQADLGRAAAVAQQQAKKIQRSIDEVNQTVGRLAHQAGAFVGSFIGLDALIRQFEAIKTATIESERSFNQLDAALVATGNSAGLTKQKLEALNTSVQIKTVFDDDEIRRAETSLLRFRKVQGDVFEDAIRLAPDLAAALGTDLNGATQALGRALTEPETGMRALRAAGISLSDQQKDLAARMIETGDRAGAQRIILDELRKSVGGAGEANNQGLGGAVARLNREWGDLEKAAGKRIFGRQGQDADLLTEALERLRKKAGETESTLLDLILHPIDAAKANTDALRAFFNVFQSKPRAVSGKIGGLGLSDEEQKAADAARNASIQDRLDQAYNEEQIQLRKRADGAAAFYHGELATQQKFLNEFNAQIEFGYGRGAVTVADFFDKQREAAEKSFKIVDAGITKQIELQHAVISAPSSNTETRENARLKILQLVNQSTDSRYAKDLRIQQLIQQEQVAVDRLKDSYIDLAAKVAEAQGDELTATRLSFQTSAVQQQRRQLQTQASSGSDSGQADARAALENLARLEDIQLAKAAERIRHTVDDVKADLLELQGNVAGAAQLRITNANDDLRRQFAGRGDTDSLARLAEVERLKIAQADLNGLQSSYNLAIEELGTIQGRVDIQLQRGAITELDSINQRAEAATRYANGLRPVVEAYEAIARASGNTADIVHAQQLRLELERLSAVSDELRKKFQDIFVGAFSDNLTALITGTKSLKNAVKDFEKSVVQSISNIASKNIGEYLFGKEGPLGGISDVFAGIFGGGKDKYGLGKTPGIAGGTLEEMLGKGGPALSAAGTTLTGAGTTLATSGTLLSTAATQLMAAAGALSAGGAAGGIGGALGLGSFGSSPGLPGSDLGGGFFNPFEGLIGFADGTNFAPGGLAMVGERGRELVNLPRGSQVLPNRITERALGGKSATYHVTNNITVQGTANSRTLSQMGREVFQGITRAQRRDG